MELTPKDPELKEVLQKFMGRMAKTFAIGLKNAQDKGEVRADLDTRKAGDALTSLMFGLAVLGRTGFSRESLDAIVTQTLDGFRA